MVTWVEVVWWSTVVVYIAKVVEWMAKLSGQVHST